MVSIHLKNISQNGNLPQIRVNIENVWNHHLFTNISDLHQVDALLSAPTLPWQPLVLPESFVQHLRDAVHDVDKTTSWGSPNGQAVDPMELVNWIMRGPRVFLGEHFPKKINHHLVIPWLGVMVLKDFRWMQDGAWCIFSSSAEVEGFQNKHS